MGEEKLLCDRISLLLLLRARTLHRGHGCGDDLSLTLGTNQTENKFPSLGDELATFLRNDQRGVGKWGYHHYPI